MPLKKCQKNPKEKDRVAKTRQNRNYYVKFLLEGSLIASLLAASLEDNITRVA